MSASGGVWLVGKRAQARGQSTRFPPGGRGGLLALAALGLWSAEPGAAPAAWNVAAVGQHWFVPVLSVADVWLDGGYAYVARQRFGLGIVDVRDPARPALVGSFNPGPGDLLVNDVQAAGRYAYLSNEGSGLPLYILDVTDPASPRFAGGIPSNEIGYVHNLEVEGTIAYIVGTGPGGWQTYIYDVSDPALPVRLAVLPDLGAHDVTAVGNLLYEAGGWSGLHIWDVTDPARPRHLAAADTNEGPRPHYHTHSAWPSEDGRYVFTTNEIASNSPGAIRAGGLKVWAWDGAAKLDLAAEWRPDAAIADSLITIHDVKAVGTTLFVSYYQAGLRVLDISDPRHPVEVGWYDTYAPRPRELFQGAWGVFAAGERRAIISDRLTGLHLLDFNGARRAVLTGEVASAASGALVPGAVVADRTADRTLTAADGTFSLTTGSGTHRFEVRAAGYRPAAVTVELLPGTFEFRRIELEPEGGSVALSALDNYPNPFNPATAITFDIGAGAGPVRLAIYDAGGRWVRDLARGPLPPGRQVARWDGTDASGRGVAGGVYFARLEGGGRAASHRMLLLK